MIRPFPRRLSVAMLALTLAVPAGAGQADAVTPGGFCARMAAQFDMRPAKPVDGHAAYEARALKGLGAALFGGQATVSMMLKPPASGDIGEPGRYATACGAVPNGLGCDVTGPALFEMAVKDQTATTDVRAGEAARITMVRNRIRCEDR